MADKRTEGYHAAFIGVLLGAIFIVIALNTGWNVSGQLFGIFGLFFSGLGVWSFFKPEEIGIILSRMLENMSNGHETDINQEQGENKGGMQMQTGVNKGVQNIYVNPDKNPKKKRSKK
jgi:hypothetical protein